MREQTQRQVSCVTIERAVNFRREERGRRRAATGGSEDKPTPEVIGSVPRISKLMALAIQFEEKIERGEVQDMAQLARLGHVSRARLTQIMNLRLLAPAIQEQLLNLPRVQEGRASVRYRDIAPIIQQGSWQEQRRLWRKLTSS